jgi:inosose dehydratase
MPAERVLGEIAGLGLHATELGPDGFLPSEPAELRTLLARHGLRLVAGFVPLVLHDPARARESLLAAERAARTLACAGAGVLVSAAAERGPEGARHWEHLLRMLGEVDGIARGHGLAHALHPHVDTMVETAEEVRRVLDGSSVAICLDTGHLTVGGADPLALARTAAARVALVHLKDVDVRLAGRVRELGFAGAVRQGLFRPLGKGGVPVREIVRELERGGYAGWYVLEQDTALDADPAEGEGPVIDMRASLDYLHV